MSSNSIEVVAQQTTVEIVVQQTTVEVIDKVGAFNVEVASAGLQGSEGPSNVLSMGTTTTAAAGSSALATITGVSPSQVLNLTIPTGNTGPVGPANTLAIGTSSILDPSAVPTVAITGASPNQTITFGLPAGTRWLSGTVAPASTTGRVGDWYLNTTTSDTSEKTAATVWTLRSNIKGLVGNTGPSNTLSVGTVTTGAAGSAATTTITGASPNQTINLGIPQGLQGTQGIQGLKGDPGTGNVNSVNSLLGPDIVLTAANVGAAASGHGHALTDTNMTGILPIAQIPSTVFHTTNLPSISQVNALTAALDAKANSASPALTGDGTIVGSFTAGSLFEGVNRVYSPNNIPSASVINAGTLADARLSTNVATLTGAQTFTGVKTIGTLNFSDFIHGMSANKAAPSFNTRSLGTRVIYSAALTSTQTDYASGAENGVLWNSVPTTTQSFKWYGGITLSAMLSGAGVLTLAGSLTATTLSGTLAVSNLSGVIAMGNIPTGITGTTVSLGNHGHDLTDANITGILPIAKIATTVFHTTNLPATSQVTGLVAALDLKAALAAPALTGAATLDGQALIKTNDARLSDARAPTTHTHTTTQVTGLDTELALKSTSASPTFTGLVKGLVSTPTAGRLSEVAADGSLVNSAINSTTLSAQISDIYATLDTKSATTHGHALTDSVITGILPQAKLIPNTQRIIFTTAGQARPTGSTYVEWVGPVQPTNAVDGDTFVSNA
jgi:hypothetical protein